MTTKKQCSPRTPETAYLAGPMRGYPLYNFPAFDEAKDYLKQWSWDAISPADIDRENGFDPESFPAGWDWNLLPPDFDLDTVLRHDLEAVLSVNMVYMLRGWTNSRGARAEHAVAVWAGKDIRYQYDDWDGEFDKLQWYEFQYRLFEEMKELTFKKNCDYTGGNHSASPFTNFDEAADYGVDPLKGLCVRMGDKVQRLKAFNSAGLALSTKGDAVADIFKDLVGYSSLALGMMERDIAVKSLTEFRSTTN